jgi:sRNA-binding protein
MTPMREGSRSSDKEVSEGVSVMALSAAVTKFLTVWAGAAFDEARILLEDEGYGSPDNSVVVEVSKRRSERQAQLVQMLMAQVQASTADAAAAETQADAALAAQAAHPASSKRFKPAPPPKFENKDKNLEIRKWLPVIEEHYEGYSSEDYLCLASS